MPFPFLEQPLPTHPFLWEKFEKKIENFLRILKTQNPL